MNTKKASVWVETCCWRDSGLGRYLTGISGPASYSRLGCLFERKAGSCMLACCASVALPSALGDPLLCRFSHLFVR
jgi:hypothetical protein